MRSRFRRRPSLSAIVLVALAALVLARIAFDGLRQTESASQRRAADDDFRQAPIFAAGPCIVLRVIHGDTLLVRQLSSSLHAQATPPVEGKVRLLGIGAQTDASASAESRSLAIEARQFSEEFVRRGIATLELDKRRRDADGTFLAYVVVDGAMLNAELVRQGLARAESRPGDSSTVARLIRRAQDEAQSARRGIWKNSNAEVADGQEGDDPA